MRCASYCTATSYHMKPLLAALKAKQLEPKFYRDVIHYRYGEGDIYCFTHGCFVSWGLTEEQEQPLLEELAGFSNNLLAKPVQESFRYELGDTTIIANDSDIIYLAKDDPLIKLAISNGLAQSIKLTTFEEAVDKTIKSTDTIPQDLAGKGRIALSRKEISRQMGKLFIVRNSINLNTEFLGVPEFFWEHPTLERYYTMAANYLEISKRVEVLNRRLDVIHELFQMLTNELQHQHSAVLEWIIIILIAVEIVIVLAKEIFHWL